MSSLSSSMSTALSVLIIVFPAPPGPGNVPPTAPSGTSVLPPVSLPSVPTVGLGQASGERAGATSPEAGGSGGALLSGSVNLAGYKLTIPEVSDKGSAASVENPSQGKPPWMTRGEDGSLHFWAPVDGATTPNSTHARTELVSLKTFTAGSGRHTLRTSLTVSQVPRSRPDIIVGQIHGAGDISSISFVMLHYDAGQIRVVVKQQQGSGGPTEKYPLISGVPLGGRFDYTITDSGDGNVVCTATYGTASRSATIPIPDVFKGATVRFQAGDYQQAESGGGGSDSGSDSSDSSGDSREASAAADGSSGQDGGRVTFFSLTEDHPS